MTINEELDEIFNDYYTEDTTIHSTDSYYPDEIVIEGDVTDEEEDIIRRPSHYTNFAIEPITFIMRNGLSFWKGNVIKYVCRAGAKKYDGMDGVESEITDLKKVMRYAEMRINMLEGNIEL